MKGYKQKNFQGETKRFVQILELRDDPDMMPSTASGIVKNISGKRFVMVFAK